MDNSSRPKPETHENLSNKWVGAGHLKTGDKLRQADGTLGEVRYVNTITQTRTMYNLSVQEAHTFFVGSHSWLVHNCDTILGSNAAKLVAERTLKSGQTKGAASVLVVDGKIVASGVSGSTYKDNDQILGLLMSVPKKNREPYLGGCSEIACLSKALNKGKNIEGGYIVTVAIGSSSPGHLITKLPCLTCANVLEQFKVTGK